MVTVEIVNSTDNTARGFLTNKNNPATGQDSNGGLHLNLVIIQSELVGPKKFHKANKHVSIFCNI